MFEQLLFTAFFCTSSLLAFSQGTQLLRQPTLSDDYVVFIYANDLWKADRNGGEAIRLTSNEGAEGSPHFSPDGSMIAFSAQYGGNTDVYVVPAEGGSPQRVTWHPGADRVEGWTPDGALVFGSNRMGHPTETFSLYEACLLYTSPSPRDLSTSRMPSSA